MTPDPQPGRGELGYDKHEKSEPRSGKSGHNSAGRGEEPRWCPHGHIRPASYGFWTCPCCGYALDPNQSCGVCQREATQVEVVQATPPPEPTEEPDLAKRLREHAAAGGVTFTPAELNLIADRLATPPPEGENER